jgi:signal transduction histidine kinase
MAAAIGPITRWQYVIPRTSPGLRRCDNRSMSERMADLLAVPVAVVAVGVSLLTIGAPGQAGVAAVRLVPLGLILLVAAGVWLARQRPASPLRDLALRTATASAMPLFAEPIRLADRPLGIALALVLGASASVLLADGLLATRSRRYRRWLVVAALAICVAAALGAVALAGRRLPTTLVVSVSTLILGAGWLLTAATTLPALVAAASRYAAPGPRDRRAIVPAAELLVAGLTPAIGWLTVYGGEATLSSVLPLGIWIAVVFGAGTFAVRPLARVATRAQVERDVVLAAMESERARLAADIHDDALQDLTLLVRRLDAAGDADGAEMTRHVADRLRAICGDLRLPILDDLGAGAALEWLVDRIERLSGSAVSLERRDAVRPPPEVELAFFRIAQEALANAVKHGAPPISVRYATDPSGASLAVDDAGRGIDHAAAAGAVSGGRFGLLNMEQRADQVGAILDVRPWPRGGTHVALEWRAT